jgi:transcriptional regulator with XRE-family HTH domain
VDEDNRTFYRDFGQRLTNIRNEAGVTQEALADAVGLSRTSITNVEKGRQPVQLHLVVKIAEILGVTVARLLPVRESTNPLPAERLEKLQPEKRKWVERVLGAPPSSLEEAGNGSKIQPVQEKGARTPAKRRNRNAADSG